MRIKLSTNEIKNIYKGTDLHVAAYSGNLVEVERVLVEYPEQYKQLTDPKSNSGPYDRRNFFGATALHYALFGEQYAVAERLLKHPDCPKIINIANSQGGSILNWIALLRDREIALNLAKLALDVNGIQLDNVNYYEYSSPLYLASEMRNLEMARLLLDRGADPNVCHIERQEPLLNHLVFNLRHVNDITRINNVNALLLLLIERGADPKRYGRSGATFFDEIIGNENIESKIDPTIKERLQDIWKISSAEEITKAKAIFRALESFAPDVPKTAPNPPAPLPLKDTALLVTLKKARKREKGSDYECTVLYGREQLDSFIKLVRLRFEALKQSFQTQFIMRPREGSNLHVANGQLNFDVHGNVNVFWVDTAGHNYSAKNDNREVGEIIHKHLPEATLYTTDTRMQSTQTGCHIFALYISERLSAATQNKRDLFGDLKKIYEQSIREEDGFRIIPWGKCPVYTGLPKIIQSASKPKARINEGLEEDKTTVNKKNQNYQQEMKRFFVKRHGKKVNSFYEVNRQKFGKHIKKAYEDEFESLNKKMLAGFTDIIDRIPVDALAEELAIKLVKQGEQWEIIVPTSYQGGYLFDLKGTKTELIGKLEDAYKNIAANPSAIEHPDFLFHYAAIQVSRAIVDSLEPEIIPVDIKPANTAAGYIIAKKGQLTFFPPDDSKETSGIEENEENMANKESPFI